MSPVRRRPMHSGLANFDDLPGAAYVPVGVVGGLFGCSVATVWRRVRDGQIPAPHRLGKRSTRWRVGDLRELLAEISSP